MRGNNFINILKNINKLEALLTDVQTSTNLKIEDFEYLVRTLGSIEGLGVSTFSKLLYFKGMHICGCPCLILDQRLIDVFRKKIFPEFEPLWKIRYGNTTKHYINYLEIMHRLSDKLITHGDNIEQFLFLFGNNLKAQEE